MIKRYRWVVGTVSGDFYVTEEFYSIAEATSKDFKANLRHYTDFFVSKIPLSVTVKLKF